MQPANKNYDLIVFDWDGTIMDSTGAIVAAIQASAQDLGLPVPEHSIASHVIGLGLQDALHMALPQLDPTTWRATAACCCSTASRNCSPT